MKPSVVAVIPARGGSKGLPVKNIRPLGGKPLIAYSIEAAKGCPLIDRVIVSTDDPEIQRVALEHGAEAPFLRPKELATDCATTESVLQHALTWLEEQEGFQVDILVFLQPTDIFRKAWMLKEVIRRLQADPNLDSAFVAFETHKNFWRITNGQPVRLLEVPYGPRQKREHLFREDTGLACATRARFIREGRRLGPRTSIVANSDPASLIDIEDEFTFWLAEQALTSGKRSVND
ncbi:MAG: acylneuraminate cytidylyltransferase family protein [Candidatus Omnitrophica bacterium]|nr:acylneuraminate cytidylyltransferase family protein [Candidatus Omnitrophota bacterium]